MEGGLALAAIGTERARQSLLARRAQPGLGGIHLRQSNGSRRDSCSPATTSATMAPLIGVGGDRTMVRKKKTAHSARGRSAKRREEQLELALPKPDDVIVRPIANLRGTSRLGAVS